MEIEKLWIDLETYSETPIKNGTYRYAEDSEIMLFLYAFDDGEVRCLDFTADAWQNHQELYHEIHYGTSEVWAHNCVTGDHEVRTPDGWMRFDALKPGVKVLQWCPKTQDLTYVLPTLVENEYEGELLSYDSLFHKGVYTPNHRIYFRTPYSKDWQVETAEQFSNRGPNSAKIPVSGFLRTDNKPIELSAVESRLTEMVRADAHISASRNRVRIRLKKQRKIDRAKSLLEQAGWGFKSYSYREATTIELDNNDRLEYIISLLGRGKEKKLGQWVLQLPTLSRLAWLDELQYWDGTRTNQAPRGGGDKAATLIVSSKKEDVYWLSEMAIQTGMNATSSYNKVNNRGFSRTDGLIHKLTIRDRHSVKTLYTPERVKYEGKVYCVNVPTGAFLIRRKGITWVTGNSMFDRTALRFNNYNVPIDRWRDTMVQALCHALPGGLDKLCTIFGIAEEDAKLKDGKSLIQLFCKPRPKNMKLRRATRETHPEEWARFIEYGKSDVRAMRSLHYAMPKFNYPGGMNDELGNWHLDQKINDRGFKVDLDLVNAAISVVKLEKEALKQQAFDCTKGAVTSATKRDQVLEHILMEYGIPLPDLTKATLERRLNDPDIPRGVKELLAIRLQATTTSTSKYLALKKATNGDGRCRGTIQFGGASRTLRAAGRTFQPQNLPSRGLLEDYEIDFGVKALKDSDAGFYFPNIMKLLSSCVRGVLIPSEGKELAVADLSAIEGRFTAWVSGEEWVLEAYREYDKGIGQDMYQVTYANAFKINPSSVTKAQRQIGKVMNLFLGFGGGCGAFVTGALGYGFDIEQLAKDNWATLPGDQLREANSFYGYVIKRKMNTFGLSKEAFITCDVLKRLWREANPNIASMWTRLEEAIRMAISNPGEVFEVGDFIKILRNKNWLRIRLPSGRSLCYANPRLSERGEISYMGMNQYTRQWQRLKGYGGLFLENCLTGDSRIVTSTGVKYLIDVTTSDRVWDGVEFVKHSGVLFQGFKELISVNGVRMTPDHKILTEEGWKIASSCEGLNRHESRLPDSYPVFTSGTQEHLVDPLRVRERDRNASQRVSEEDEETESLLRLQVQRIRTRNDFNTQDVRTSGVLGVAINEGSLQTTYAPGMEKLRSAWDYCLRALAGFYEILGGHGADLGGRRRTGATRQRKGLLPTELCLEKSEESGKQPSREQTFGHSSRANELERSGSTLWNRKIDLSLSIRPRLGPEQSSGFVYDLMNCGPRNRFAVLDENNTPIIVHNCAQAGSRDILYSSMPRAEAAGFQIVLHVHDELVTEFDPQTELTLDNLCEILSSPVPWAPGLPLSAAGFQSTRYRK